jgi:hypothetical protein
VLATVHLVVDVVAHEEAIHNDGEVVEVPAQRDREGRLTRAVGTVEDDEAALRYVE